MSRISSALVLTLPVILERITQREALMPAEGKFFLVNCHKFFVETVSH
jgi:hypothetical protein